MTMQLNQIAPTHVLTPSKPVHIHLLTTYIYALLYLDENLQHLRHQEFVFCRLMHTEIITFETMKMNYFINTFLIKLVHVQFAKYNLVQINSVNNKFPVEYPSSDCN